MWINKADIEKARQVNLLDYLPQSALLKHGKGYKLAEDHSLKIEPDGKWFWWSNNIGGFNALDFIIRYEGKGFQEAVMTLLNNNLTYESKRTPAPVKKEEHTEFELPEKNNNNEKARHYLIIKRGIEPHIVDYCIDKGLIYETKKYNNAVFVGMNEKGLPKYGALRGTMNGSSFKGEVYGSDKSYAFSISEAISEGKGQLELFESAIDALSYASFLSLMYNDGGAENKDFWRDTNYLSLAGIYAPKPNSEREAKLPVAFVRYMEEHKGVTNIILHLDNDDKGIEAAQFLQKAISDKYPEVRVNNEPPTFFNKAGETIEYKDWNDALIAYRKEYGFVPRYAPALRPADELRSQQTVPVLKQFNVEIVETLSRTYVISAATPEKDEKIARGNYESGRDEYVLGADDIVSVDFNTEPVRQPAMQQTQQHKPAMRR